MALLPNCWALAGGSLQRRPSAAPTSSSPLHLTCTAYLSRSWTAQSTRCLRTRTRSPCRSFPAPGSLFGRQPASSKTSAASPISLTAWRSGRGQPSAPRRQLRPSVARSLPEGFRLTERQAEVAKGLLTSGHSLDLVVGVAGSGKTSTLSAVREGFEAAGYKVLGAATSGQAAKALGEGAGVASRTVASLTWRIEHGQEVLSPRHVLVLDEGSMTSDSDVGKAVGGGGVLGGETGRRRRLPPARLGRPGRRARSPRLPPPRPRLDAHGQPPTA